MKWLASRTLWGLLLIVGGIIFLLENLNIISVGGLFWAVVLGVAALGFLSVFLTDRQHWWALIPGLTLLAVAAIVFIDAAFPTAAGDWSGSIVLAGISLAFLLIYLNDRQHWWALIPGLIMLAVAAGVFLENVFPAAMVNWTPVIILGGIGLAFLIVYLVNLENWWAIIPGGVMFTLAAVVLLGQSLPDFAIGGIFFLGLGLTFALVAVLPAGQSREQMRWAYIPAGILFLIGLLLTAFQTATINYMWPLALILVGLYLVFRTVIVRR